MPTYNYKCAICNTVEEKEHGMLEQPVFTHCNTQMIRLISKILGISFKGSGFYSTDKKG